MATVIGAIIVFGIVALIIGKMIYDRVVHHKSGCSCGCDCSSCGGGCHEGKY